MEPVNFDRAVGFYDDTRGFPFLQAPQTAVDWFRNRAGSSTWNLTDAAIAQVVAALEAFIHERFADPSVPVPVEECFHVVRYFAPQG